LSVDGCGHPSIDARVYVQYTRRLHCSSPAVVRVPGASRWLVCINPFLVGVVVNYLPERARVRVLTTLENLENSVNFKFIQGIFVSVIVGIEFCA